MALGGPTNRGHEEEGAGGDGSQVSDWNWVHAIPR